MPDAQGLRARMRAMRRALSQQEQLAATRAVCDHLQRLPALAQARTVMAYMAARGELSLEPLLEELLGAGKTLCLPRCEEAGHMSARRVTMLSELVPGAYGLLEPGGDCPETAPDEIDAVLVPGTAFDACGGRVGQGGGYYDRFLPQTRAYRIGVCHDFALLGSVPVQAHDQRMDAVVCPSGLTVAHEYRRIER
ncbi:MAG: 5-formyltetrahydrofolate cyclo-ligase [Clostridiales bacterium]|nr:5-formyltetrahydrofolate cyclo-ligase [Clostridiales bacterium]